jgi:hypothetical protein
MAHSKNLVATGRQRLSVPALAAASSPAAAEASPTTAMAVHVRDSHRAKGLHIKPARRKGGQGGK